MIKRLLKWVLITIAGLLIVVIAAALMLPFVLPLDRIKDFVADKMSETLRREVTIGKVSFNIFTGIGIDDLHIGNKAGFSKKPFVKADKIEFRYDLWSLFSGKFRINKVALIGPEILLEKKGSSTNFSDLIPAPKPKAKPKAKDTKKKAAPPININISSFVIKNAALSYINYENGQALKSGFNDLDLGISGIAMDFSSPIKFGVSANVIYNNKPVPVSLSGVAAVNTDQDKASITNLKLGAAGETITSNIYISSMSKSQDVKFDLKSGRINVDKFLAVISGREQPKKTTAAKPPHGKLTRSVNKMSSSIPAGLKIDGKIDLNNIQYKEMVLDRLNVSVVLADRVLKIYAKDTEAYNGKLNGTFKVNFTKPGLAYKVFDLKISGFNATPATNAFVRSFLMDKLEKAEDLVDKVEGTLSLSADLYGSGVEMPEILKNADGKISFKLENGKLKKLKSLEGVGSKIGLTMLKNDMDIKIFEANASISGGVMNVTKLHADNGESGDLIVDFRGPLDLINKKYKSGNVLTLRLSPRVAPKELDSFKDKSGWAELEFELVGSLSKPIPVPKLGKQIEKAKERLKEQVDEEIEKQKEEAKKEADKKIEELKEEAGEKIKELFKF